jgi:hypothetical protein
MGVQNQQKELKCLSINSFSEVSQRRKDDEKKNRLTKFHDFSGCFVYFCYLFHDVPGGCFDSTKKFWFFPQKCPVTVVQSFNQKVRFLVCFKGLLALFLGSILKLVNFCLEPKYRYQSISNMVSYGVATV